MVRIVEGGTSVQPSPYNNYRVPTDVIDIATGMDSNKLIDFLQLVRLENISGRLKKPGNDVSVS